MQGRAHAFCLAVVIRGKAKRQAERQVTVETDRRRRGREVDM